MNTPTVPLVEEILAPVSPIQGIELPDWQALPAEYQHELVLALAELLMAQVEVSHEPCA